MDYESREQRVESEESRVCIESICWQSVAPSNGSYKLLYALLQMLLFLLWLFSLWSTHKGCCVCVCVIEIVLAIISQELQRDKHNENKRNNNSNKKKQQQVHAGVYLPLSIKIYKDLHVLYVHVCSLRWMAEVGVAANINSIGTGYLTVWLYNITSNKSQMRHIDITITIGKLNESWTKLNTCFVDFGDSLIYDPLTTPKSSSSWSINNLLTYVYDMQA